MSEENLQRQDEATSGAAETPEPAVAHLPEMTVNRATKELTFTDPASGKTATLKVNVIDEEPEEDEIEEEIEPLTPDQFRDALKRLDNLGLTWSADRVPSVRAKDPANEGALISDEFREIQDEYPTLPRELQFVVSYALTENKIFVGSAAPLVGGDEYLEQKAAIVREMLVSPDFRSEFFFKHSIKVPYLEGADWEVVFKTFEKNVRTVPAVSYALVSLSLHNPDVYSRGAKQHTEITVALDLNLTNRLIDNLTDVKKALEHSRKLTEVFYQQAKAEAESHEAATNSE